jgi:hypothetical protein
MKPHFLTREGLFYGVHTVSKYLLRRNFASQWLKCPCSLNTDLLLPSSHKSDVTLRRLEVFVRALQAPPHLWFCILYDVTSSSPLYEYCWFLKPSTLKMEIVFSSLTSIKLYRTEMHWISNVNVFTYTEFLIGGSHTRDGFNLCLSLLTIRAVLYFTPVETHNNAATSVGPFIECLVYWTLLQWGHFRVPAVQSGGWNGVLCVTNDVQQYCQSQTSTWKTDMSVSILLFPREGVNYMLTERA